MPRARPLLTLIAAAICALVAVVASAAALAIASRRSSAPSGSSPRSAPIPPPCGGALVLQGAMPGLDRRRCSRSRRRGRSSPRCCAPGGGGARTGGVRGRPYCCRGGAISVIVVVAIGTGVAAAWRPAPASRVPACPCSAPWPDDARWVPSDPRSRSWAWASCLGGPWRSPWACARALRHGGRGASTVPFVVLTRRCRGPRARRRRPGTARRRRAGPLASSRTTGTWRMALRGLARNRSQSAASVAAVAVALAFRWACSPSEAWTRSTTGSTTISAETRTSSIRPRPRSSGRSGRHRGVVAWSNLAVPSATSRTHGSSPRFDDGLDATRGDHAAHRRPDRRLAAGGHGGRRRSPRRCSCPGQPRPFPGRGRHHHRRGAATAGHPHGGQGPGDVPRRGATRRRSGVPPAGAMRTYVVGTEAMGVVGARATGRCDSRGASQPLTDPEALALQPAVPGFDPATRWGSPTRPPWPRSSRRRGGRGGRAPNPLGRRCPGDHRLGDRDLERRDLVPRYALPRSTPRCTHDDKVPTALLGFAGIGAGGGAHLDRHPVAPVRGRRPRPRGACWQRAPRLRALRHPGPSRGPCSHCSGAASPSRWGGSR